MAIALERKKNPLRKTPILFGVYCRLVTGPKLLIG